MALVFVLKWIFVIKLSLLNPNQVSLIRQEALHVWRRVFFRLYRVVNASKDDDLLVGHIVRDHTHCCVAKMTQLMRIVRVLNLDPYLLVKQEQMHVVQERSYVHITDVIVTSPDYYDSIADW